MDHILLEGHNATYDDFSILVAEKYQFNLHLKETLLIKRDKPELNGNIYTHPLELLPNDISYLRLFLWRRSIKKDVLKHFVKFIGKSQCPSLFLEACRFFWKRRLAKVFSCKLCKIFKNIFFTEQLRATTCEKSNDRFFNSF